MVNVPRVEKASSIPVDTQGIHDNGNEPVSQSDLERIATSLANNALSGDDVMTVKNLGEDGKEQLAELLEQKGVSLDTPLLKILHAVIDLLNKFESDSPDTEQLKATVVGQALLELNAEYKRDVGAGERDALPELERGYDQLVGRRAAEILIARFLEEPSILDTFETTDPLTYTAMVMDPTLVEHLRRTYEGEE